MQGLYAYIPTLPINVGRWVGHGRGGIGLVRSLPASWSSLSTWKGDAEREGRGPDGGPTMPEISTSDVVGLALTKHSMLSPLQISAIKLVQISLPCRDVSWVLG